MTYQEGDPNHLQTHNELTADVGDLASSMGVEVVLPDTAVVGSTGHVDDHNLIKDALDKIAAEGSAGASWAQVISAPDAVTGSYYDDKGGQWAFYEWNAAGTFDVELSGGLVWVLACGGGSTGYGDQVAQLQGGQPGNVIEGLWEFGPGTHPVTVGAGGRGTDPTNRGGVSSIGDYGVQGEASWGDDITGRGATAYNDDSGHKSRITGEELHYGIARDANPNDRPGRPARRGTGLEASDGCVIIATRIDVPTLPPAPPRLEVAPVVAKPVSISGPDVQEWLVRDKQGARKLVYFLPGNTGTARSLALTDEGAEALAARRELLDAIATTDVPEDFEGDPVTLLPKKLRGELTGFVEVRAVSQPEAVFSVTLGAGVLPGVMVAAGCCGPENSYSGSGAGGVIGQGAHQPVILPVQGTATYTVKVASTCPYVSALTQAQPTTIAVQGQTPFATAVGGGQGYNAHGGQDRRAGSGGNGGGGSRGEFHDNGNYFAANGHGVPGQGNDGNSATYGGGGGYGSGGESTANGGAGFDLAGPTALNLDANDGITGSFLAQVSVDGWIAGGGAGQGGTATAGGAAPGGNAKDYTGGGGSGIGGTGGAGAVYIITDPT